MLYNITHKPAQFIWLMKNTVELKVKGFTQPCQTWNLNTQPSANSALNQCKLGELVVVAQWLRLCLADKTVMCSNPKPICQFVNLNYVRCNSTLR